MRGLLVLVSLAIFVAGGFFVRWTKSDFVDVL
jgi:hypothetical protein